MTQNNIRELLNNALNPSYLNIIDDGHLHIGHRPPTASGGHYTVQIAADLFSDKSLRQCHQLVYAAVATLLKQDIHALGITIIRS